MTPWALLYYLYDLSSFCIRLFMLFYLPLKHSPTTATSWLLAVYLWPWPVAVLYAVFSMLDSSFSCLTVPPRGADGQA